MEATRPTEGADNGNEIKDSILFLEKNGETQDMKTDFPFLDNSSIIVPLFGHYKMVRSMETFIFLLIALNLPSL